MKLHREDLSFIFTHSSTFIGDMPYLTININQQLNVTAYLWNYAMKSYIKGGGFILMSNWHGTLCNSVIKLCTEIGLAVWHLPFGFHRVSCLVSNLDQSATAAYGLQDRSTARSENYAHPRTQRTPSGNRFYFTRINGSSPALQSVPWASDCFRVHRLLAVTSAGQFIPSKLASLTSWNFELIK